MWKHPVKTKAKKSILELLAGTACLEKGHLPDTELCSSFSSMSWLINKAPMSQSSSSNISICRQAFFNKVQ